jgi:hypothetical protein
MVGNEIGGPCSTNGEYENAYKRLIGKPERKGLLILG